MVGVTLLVLWVHNVGTRNYILGSNRFDYWRHPSLRLPKPRGEWWVFHRDRDGSPPTRRVTLVLAQLLTGERDGGSPNTPVSSLKATTMNGILGLQVSKAFLTCPFHHATETQLN